MAECGIKFSIVKHFKGAPVQGVIKKNDDGTLSLLMTTRRKYADIFWFTLFHEIGHIINGDIEDKLIDYDFTENEAEDRANEFAANTLIDAEEYDGFVGKGDFSLLSIKRFCLERNIPTYILIGRLQRDKHLKYHQYSAEKVRYELRDNFGGIRGDFRPHAQRQNRQRAYGHGHLDGLRPVCGCSGINHCFFPLHTYRRTERGQGKGYGSRLYYLLHTIEMQ